MNTFFKNLTKFILGIIVIFILLSVWFYFRIEKKNIWNIKLNRFNSYPHAVKVLFIGDSHPEQSIKNKFLPEDFYNFSNSAANAKELFLLIKYIYKKQPTIKFIVLPIEYHNFNCGFADNLYLDHIRYLNPEKKDLRFVYKDIPLYKIKFQFLIQRLPLLMQKNRELFAKVLINDLLLFILGKKAQVYDSLGDTVNLRVWTHKNEETRFKDSRSRAKVQSLENIKSDDLVRIFYEIINFCDKNKIKIIGIKYPITNEYLSIINTYDINSVNKIYDDTKIFKRLDYMDLFKDKQDYFGNPDHLNDTGAEIFTNIVVKELQKIITDEKK